MDGRRWSIPTRLYSDVWVLKPGDALGPDDVERRLARLRYAPVPAPPVSGGRYLVSRSRIVIGVNPHETAYGRFPGIVARIDFSGRRIARLKRDSDGALLRTSSSSRRSSARSSTRRWRTGRSSASPRCRRSSWTRSTTEDRDFSTRWSRPEETVGAVLQGLVRGRCVRDEHATQQYVKDLFLTPERTIRRERKRPSKALLAVILATPRTARRRSSRPTSTRSTLGQARPRRPPGRAEARGPPSASPPSQLHLPEAAMLAWLISSPVLAVPQSRERRPLAARWS